MPQRHDEVMGREQQQRDTDELALLELVLAASERRHGVVDAVWESKDIEEATERVRELLDLGDTDPTVVLDMQISRLTKEMRDQITARVHHLREALRDG